MHQLKGPAIDPEAFRVEGHCCGIRIPALLELTGAGIRFELTPAARAELTAQGLLPPELNTATTLPGPASSLFRTDDGPPQR